MCDNALIWMNLVNVMLDKRSQSLRTTYCMTSFIGHFQAYPQRQKLDEFLAGAGERGLGSDC